MTIRDYLRNDVIIRGYPRNDVIIRDHPRNEVIERGYLEIDGKTVEQYVRGGN